MKKLLSVLLVMLMVFSIVSCTKNEEPKATEESKSQATEAKSDDAKATEEPAEVMDEGPLFSEPVTLKIMLSSNASWPYDPEWWVIKAIEEATNVKYDVISVLENYDEKFNITMASGDLPDLIFGKQSQVNKFYADGPFAAFSDYLDVMPNAQALIENNEDFAYKLDIFKMSDGKVYLFPFTGIEVTYNKRGWLARLDLLEKNGLDIPTTDAELYEVLKSLKQAYPATYPLAFRKGVDQFEIIGPNYGTDIFPFYDYENNVWKYGPVTDEFKEMVTFYNKLFQEEIIPPDILTLSTQGWTDMIFTEQSFFTVDYINRMDFFNIPMKEEIPDVDLHYIDPPIGPSLSSGDKSGFKSGLFTEGFICCDTAKTDQSIMLLDWMYSDEAAFLTSWGKEGETYNIVDGKKTFIRAEEGARIEQLYGFDTKGIGLRANEESILGVFSDEVVDALIQSGKVEQDKYNPYRWVALNEEEIEINQTLGNSIHSYAMENISKFFIGERDLSEWDLYVKEIEDLGLEEYLKIFESAYNRSK